MEFFQIYPDECDTHVHDRARMEIIWQAEVTSLDIKWEARPLVLRLDHAILLRRRVQIRAFLQAAKYQLDNVQEKVLWRPGWL